MRFPTWLDRCLLAVLALYGVVVLFVLLLAPHFMMPSEDAVILFQYSQNLAHHGAITYYVGGPRAEGATDFAWMVLIAAAIKLHSEPFVFVSVVNACALVGLAVALLRLGRLRVTLMRVLAICGAAGFCPQIVAAVGGFSVLPFALLLVLLGLMVDRKRAAGAASVALLLCLFRPDGVVFALPLLIVLLLPPGQRGRRLAAIGLWFVLPGLVYFGWRAHYFGGWFPLPFLVKSDTPRVFHFFEPTSFKVSLKYLGFDTVLLLPLMVRRGAGVSERRLLVALALVPTLFYWAMRLSQNIGERFYFFLPVAAAVMIVLSWDRLTMTRKRLVAYGGLAAWFGLLMLPMQTLSQTFLDFQSPDVRGIARDLGALPQRGRMLTTEAGFLAYDSGWVVYDAWGLNTREFAEHLLQPEDVVALRPDVVVNHPDHGDPCVPAKGWPAAYASGRTWQHMTRNLTLGAHNARGYELWALSYGSPAYRERMHRAYGQGDRECFLVRKDSPLRDGIVAALQQHHAVAVERWE